MNTDALDHIWTIFCSSVKLSAGELRKTRAAYPGIYRNLQQITGQRTPKEISAAIERSPKDVLRKLKKELQKVPPHIRRTGSFQRHFANLKLRNVRKAKVDDPKPRASRKRPKKRKLKASFK